MPFFPLKFCINGSPFLYRQCPSLSAWHKTASFDSGPYSVQLLASFLTVSHFTFFFNCNNIKLLILHTNTATYSQKSTMLLSYLMTSVPMLVIAHSTFLHLAALWFGSGMILSRRLSLEPQVRLRALSLGSHSTQCEYLWYLLLYYLGINCLCFISHSRLQAS